MGSSASKSTSNIDYKNSSILLNVEQVSSANNPTVYSENNDKLAVNYNTRNEKKPISNHATQMWSQMCVNSEQSYDSIPSNRNHEPSQMETMTTKTMDDDDDYDLPPSFSSKDTPVKDKLSNGSSELRPKTPIHSSKDEFIIPKNLIRNPIFSIIDFYYKNINYNTITELCSNDNLTFTEDEIKIIRYTWNYIQMDLNKVGVMLFMKSFESLPEMKNVFEAFRDMNSEDLIKSHTLRTHSRKVMSVVNELVMQIDNPEKPYVQYLTELGKRHSIYGANNNFLYIMEKQFIDSIRPILLKSFYEASLGDREGNLLDSCDNSPFTKSRASSNNEDLNETIVEKSDNNFLNVNETFSPLNEKQEINIFTDEEIQEKMVYVESIWHRLFSIIKKYMSDGILEKEIKNKNKLLVNRNS